MANLMKALFQKPRNPPPPPATTEGKEEEEEKQRVEEILKNWKPPKIPTSDVYPRKGIIFKFKSSLDSVVRKVERTFPIRNEYQDFHLLTKSEVLQLRRSYKNLHIGLVQVAVKPLRGEERARNKSIVIAYRDGRFLRLKPSILAVFESPISDGPVYFNCYPNYTVSLEDPWILEIFSLHVKINGLIIQEKSDDEVALFYRFYYRASNHFFFRERTKNEFENNRTTFVQTNLLRDGHLPESKTVEWDSVEIPERWRVQFDKIQEEDNNSVQG